MAEDAVRLPDQARSAYGFQVASYREAYHWIPQVEGQSSGSENFGKRPKFRTSSGGRTALARTYRLRAIRRE